MSKTISRRLLVSLCLIITLFYIGSIPVSAAQTDQSYQHVYDKADLLSTSELNDLEDLCITYGDKAGIEIMILTHDDSSAPYIENYIEDFEDTLPIGDRVYLGMDMIERDVFIEGFGSAETYIHSKRINTIINKITPDLSDGNYYDAFAAYIKMAADYMSDDSELNYDHDYTAETPQSTDPDAPNYDATWPSDRNSTKSQLLEIMENPLVLLGISLLVGAITVAIMAYNSSGRMTAGGNNYIDQNHSGLIGRRDIYLRTTVTRVRKPQDNQNNRGGGFNAGGFRGGVSGGGRSHSSGGGKF
ncbi:MAG: TPM domain-containing protein [Mobilitalea sp.]